MRTQSGQPRDEVEDLGAHRANIGETLLCAAFGELADEPHEQRH